MRIGFRYTRFTTYIKPILFILLVISVPVTASEWQGECVGVADGDTITVLRDKKQIKIRLYGVDCPERRQDFGTQASEFVAGIVFRKLVTITPIDTDRYGRTVGLVEVDDREVNRELVIEGYAWVYPQYCKIPECEEWRELEEKAREEKRGLWAHPNPVPPWEWRKKKRSGQR